jgi:predicted transcriptional regulator
MSNNIENYTTLTAEIVSAYVANNSVQAGNLSALITSVYGAVAGLVAPVALSPRKPAVDPKRSVRDDFIICLEDGKKLVSLKRHLMAHHGLTPEEYRARWGLRASYPMVAPNFSNARSQLAKKMGLGGKLGKNVKSTALVKQTAPAKAKRAKPA